MLNKLFLLTLLSLLIVSAFVNMANADPINPTVQWSKTFGYGDACSVLPSGDGNFLVAAEFAYLPICGTSWVSL